MNKKQLLFKILGLTLGIALLLASFPVTKIWMWLMIPGVYLLNLFLFPWDKMSAFLKTKVKQGRKFLGYVLIIMLLFSVIWVGYTQLEYGIFVPFRQKFILMLLLFFVCFLDGISESLKNGDLPSLKRP